MAEPLSDEESLGSRVIDGFTLSEDEIRVLESRQLLSPMFARLLTALNAARERAERAERERDERTREYHEAIDGLERMTEACLEAERERDEARAALALAADDTEERSDHPPHVTPEAEARLEQTRERIARADGLSKRTRVELGDEREGGDRG